MKFPFVISTAGRDLEAVRQTNKSSDLINSNSRRINSHLTETSASNTPSNNAAVIASVCADTPWATFLKSA